MSLVSQSQSRRSADSEHVERMRSTLNNNREKLIIETQTHVPEVIRRVNSESLLNNNMGSFYMSSGLEGECEGFASSSGSSVYSDSDD